jgi:hypothetical protein
LSAGKDRAAGNFAPGLSIRGPQLRRYVEMEADDADTI